MARFLVTGGGGFIGSNLTEALLGRGDDVTVLDDFSTGRRENLAGVGEWTSGGGSFRLVEGDIRDAETCREAMDGVDFVQESVPERIESKRQVLQAIDAVLNPAVIIASSTSGLLPTDLQHGCAHPERIVVGVSADRPAYLVLASPRTRPGSAGSRLARSRRETRTSSAGSKA